MSAKQLVSSRKAKIVKTIKMVTRLFKLVSKIRKRMAKAKRSQINFTHSTQIQYRDDSNKQYHIQKQTYTTGPLNHFRNINRGRQLCSYDIFVIFV